MNAFSAQTMASIVGTPAFMAPETRDGLGSDFAADVYSWAVTTINILTRDGEVALCSWHLLLVALIVDNDSSC